MSKTVAPSGSKKRKLDDSEIRQPTYVWGTLDVYEFVDNLKKVRPDNICWYISSSLHSWLYETGDGLSANDTTLLPRCIFSKLPTHKQTQTHAHVNVYPSHPT